MARLFSVVTELFVGKWRFDSCFYESALKSQTEGGVSLDYSLSHSQFDIETREMEKEKLFGCQSCAQFDIEIRGKGEQEAVWLPKL